MKRLSIPLLLLILASGLAGHPMGNFSVNHYASLTVTPHGLDVHYALDLAEIPTFDLLRQWNLDRSSPRQQLESKATEQARQWLKALAFSVDGRPTQAKFVSDQLTIADGAGNLPILRIAIVARIPAAAGKLIYEDHNYPDRTGWKEIVIDSSRGAKLVKASQTNKDLSHALTQYPPDPTIAPPQDLRGELEWRAPQPLSPIRPPVVAQIPQPHLTPAAPAPATLTAQAAPPGSVVRGDFISQLLHRREITPWMMMLAIGAAFLLGAAHALTPGHGKSIVAAYLVGSRGTFKHAMFLGAMVTFTHTISVFALGIATLFLFRYFVPERITQVLGVISGLSIVIVGAWMLFKRLRDAHSYNHELNHVHSHGGHGHTHVHSHGGHGHAHVHSHGDHGHTHIPEEISWNGLVALGISGGLVPCESALVLLLGAIALGRVGLGLLLLLSFSLGLALVLMVIGMFVLYAKNLIPERKRNAHSGLLQWLAIASPAVVMLVGLVMTGVSLGWIQPKWMIG
jgi:nickel/cobalt transporter (NicO) family protein